jgi:GAF domain-containing protein
VVEMSILDFDLILSDIRQFADAAKDLAELQEFCVSRIAERLPHYNWAGFYMLDTNEPKILVLGPFRGVPTEHVRIPVGQGICGAAVAEGNAIIVEDVTSDPRYLACSLETQSEIVVPIWVDGEIAGEIDIDSHSQSAFGGADRVFLEEGAAVVGDYITQHPG